MGGKRISGKTGKAKAPKRVVRPPDPIPPNRRLVWCFGRLDHETQFGCQTLLRTNVQTLEGELAVFQEKSIPALLRKSWLKFIRVEEMTPDGQKELAKVSVQEDGLWQLRLRRDKWRIWGYFEDPKFYFLWWDSNHGVATGRSRRRKA